ncbi:hypothetical protein IBO79_003990 [Salmonella enterica]|nr:hypothetical protein [Salmonella enterica]ECD7580009.1 hypothetical protein [Salmonella enterica subsp. enterica]ECZ9826714.1 hypothetical protein [Salmonella enterica subsp. enterica serovar Sandiego]EDF0193547.1 hypothetical protein [Salmonella enterica subsp. enterica serovar Enteritidis]EDL9740730.1 hypothetical protein [Salmonella enterica subsp. enterica serovar Newport]EGK2013023.1 hypothetical protein [Escherichia coli]HBJ7416594.1 hypothetical protein [Salmonella enterica subsp. e
MVVILLIYLVPAFFLIFGIISAIRKWLATHGVREDNKPKTVGIGAGTFITAALVWIILAIFIIGTPSEILKEKNDTEARRSNIINTCKKVESGRDNGIFSGVQDGYLCKDGVVYYIAR